MHLRAHTRVQFLTVDNERLTRENAALLAENARLKSENKNAKDVSKRMYDSVDMESFLGLKDPNKGEGFKVRLLVVTCGVRACVHFR